MAKRTSKLAKTLEGPFTRIARAMSRNYGVTVIASGFECNTDGTSTIRIPFNSDDLRESDQQVLHGMLDHEVQHVVEERQAAEAKLKGFDVLTPNEVMKRAKSQTERLMVNVYEDIRIEAKASKAYIGVAENLRAANRHSVDAFKRRHDAGDLERAGFWQLLGSGIIITAQDGDTSWIPEGMKPYLAMLKDEIEDARTSGSVEDSWELAKRTMAKMKEAAEEAEREEEKRKEEKKKAAEELKKKIEEAKKKGEKVKVKLVDGDGDDDDSGAEISADDVEIESDERTEKPSSGKKPADGEDEDEGDRADKKSGVGGKDEDEDGSESEDKDSVAGESDEDAEDADGETEGSSGSDGEDEDEEGGEVAGDAKGGAFSDLTDEELAKAKRVGKGVDEDAKVSDMTKYAREDVEKRARKDATSHRRYIPNPEAQRLDRWVKPDGNKHVYEMDRIAVNSQVHAMRSKLLTILRARSEAHHVGDKERGALDASALYSLRLGNKRVFSQRTKADTLDTAISVVIDLSGSMTGEPAKMARQMAIALGETFTALNLPFEIVGFFNASRGRCAYSEEYTRYMPFDYYLFKGFNESYKLVRDRLSAVEGYEQNVDGEAILAFAYRLNERPEARKIMFILSDGEPAGGCPSGDSQKHLVEVTKRITSAGIEIIGIGANTDAVKRWYNKENGASNVVIRDINTLAVEVYKIMRARLLGRGAA